MFDKKKMKLVSFEKAKKYLMQGIQVFMVKLDGTLVEVTEATDWKSLFFHNLKQGSYAVYRRKFSGFSAFRKDIRIGKRTLNVEHTKKGGGASWRFASYRENQ